MANNRMYLRCDECGKSFMLAKSMGGGYYTRSSNPGEPSFEERLNAFMDQHDFCGIPAPLGTRLSFRLTYEQVPDDRKDLEEPGKMKPLSKEDNPAAG